MGRQTFDRHMIVSNSALNLGGRSTFKQEFPLGEGIHLLNLEFTFNVTIGTGAGPVVDGLYKAIRNISLRTDRGESLCNNPGKFFWFMNLTKNGTPPRSTPLAAATQEFVCNLQIPFTDPKTMNPNDTILDMSRYSSIQMEIQMGTIADLFTAPGTAVLNSVTLNMEVKKTRGLLPANTAAKPSFHVSYDQFAPVDANTTTQILLDTVPDLSYKRLYLATTNPGTAGQPFLGTFVDNVISTFSLKDQSSDLIRNVKWTMIQAENALHYGWDVGATEATPSYPIAYPAGFLGLCVISFIGDGESLKSALYSGDRASLLLNWVNAAAPAGSIVTLGYEAIRTLK